MVAGDKKFETKLQRKERRKNARLKKKQNRQIYNQRFQKKSSKDDSQTQVDTKVAKKVSQKTVNKSKSINPKPEKLLPINKIIESESDEETSNLTPGQVRLLQHKEAMEDDEKEIKKLEKLLKFKKRKNKTNKIPQGFKDMGLDYILEFIDGPKDIYSDKDATKELLSIFSKDKTDEKEIDEDKDLGSNIKTNTLSNKKTKKHDVEKTNKTPSKINSKRKTDTDSEMVPNKRMKKSIEDISSDESSNNIHCKEAFEEEEESIEDEEMEEADNDESIEDENNDESIEDENDDESIEDENDEEEMEETDDESIEYENDDESIVDEKEMDEADIDESIEEENTKEETDDHDDDESIEEENAKEETEDHDDDESIKEENANEEMEDHDDESIEGDDEIDDEEEEISENSDVDKPDIYGQKNAKKLEEQSSNLSEIDSKELERAQKSLNHCLKFVRDSEFQIISKLIQELYREHSRNIINKTLMSNLEEILQSKFMQDEELLIKYAQIIASLHANVGTEVGAHVLQNTARQFDSAYKKEETSHCMNIITFLSYLFAFNVSHSLLLFDILAQLGKTLSELDIKLILVVLKNVGFHLRKSDVQSTEGLVATLTELLRSKFPTQEEGSNVKLLLDILHAIKTRSLYKKLTNDPSEVDRHKKQIKLQLPKGTEVQELKISYQDLLNAEGKVGWWIVGGGWEDPTAQMGNSDNPLGNVKLPKFDKKLEKLAESFNMNTELRKAIFCILMSYDINEVFGRIQGLKLKSPHERDVVLVIVTSCLHYAKFKPMFGTLLSMLCKQDRHKYFMAIKCCLWDKMNELEDLTDTQLAILSKLVSQLLTDSVVPITFLKPQYFTTPSKNAIRFMKILLLEILMTDSEYNCKNIFCKIARLPKFAFLCESIKAYLSNHTTSTRPKMKPADQVKFDKRLKMIMDALSPEIY